MRFTFKPSVRGTVTAGLGVAWLAGIVWLAGGSGLLAQAARGAAQAPAGRGTTQAPARGAQTPPVPTQYAPALRPGLKSEEVFKNVQVLKGISVDDFMGTMGVMCASLAFDCSDCHEAAGTDHVDWAADNPIKIRARNMVTMMLKINQENFPGRQSPVVTCWTCHRNRDRPLMTPTMDVMYGSPPEQRDDVVAAAPGNKVTADQIFDKYIAAVGGAQRWSQINSYASTGTNIGFGGFGGAGEVRIYASRPDKRTTIIDYKGAPGRGDSTRTYNGSAGWLKTPLTVLGEYALSGGELDGARLDAVLGFPNQIKTSVTNPRVGFSSSVDDKPTQVVQAEGPRGLMTTFYFETETGLLLRMIRYAKSPIGRVPTQVDLSDYRDVNGVKMPFKWTFAWLDGRDSFQIDRVQLNTAVEERRFGRPGDAIR